MGDTSTAYEASQPNSRDSDKVGRGREPFIPVSRCPAPVIGVIEELFAVGYTIRNAHATRDSCPSYLVPFAMRLLRGNCFTVLAAMKLSAEGTGMRT